MLGKFRRYQMFSKTKNRELEEVQTPFSFLNRYHCGEDVKFYPPLSSDLSSKPELHRAQGDIIKGKS